MGVVALGLAACGGGGGSSSSSPPPPPPPPPAQYSIGGTVSGLTGTLVLQDNGGDNLSITQNGSFTFATKVNSGSAYKVTVMTQPTGETCAVTNGSGTASANVTNVTVSCTAAGSGVTIGGSVTGLTGTGLVLQDNGGDNLSVTQNGSFTFATSLATGKTYAVTVATQPSGETCTVTNGSGTAGSTNVTNVAVACAGAAGKFAYTANNGDGTIDAYTINPTSGALTSAGSPVADGTSPAAVSLAPNGKFAFSASDNGTKIQAYTIDQTTGALTLVGTFTTGFVKGTSYPDIAVDSQSAHLYLASAGDNEVAAFSIDSTTGKLTELNGGKPYPAGAGASAIPAFSPNGKFLYVMDATANAVSGYAIATDGSLTPMASTFPTGASPSWIVFTPNGNFAYVANSGEDTISAYSVNGTTGALTPLSVPTVTTDAHPADLTIDATGTHLYAPVWVATTATSTGAIDVYSIGTNGTLTAVQTGATAQATGINPIFLDIDPTAPFAYVADKGGAEVYGYSINSTTGALTPVTGSPFSTGAGSLPQFITIDPSGKFGYTANEGTGNISQFSVDSTSGKLTPIGTGTVPAGLKPIFVSISPEAPGIRD